MEKGNEQWDADRLSGWINKLMMPTSSQSLSRPQTVRCIQTPLLLPDGQVSFITLNKSRSRPTEKTKHKQVDKLSVFFERVAGEAGPEMALRTDRNRKLVCGILGEVLKLAFVLEPRFMRVFDMPLELVEDEVSLEAMSDCEFNCRLFLHKFEHPDAIKVTSGVQDDLPPGVALCQVSEKLTPPEQMRTKHQMSQVMDELGYISPSKIFPWFAQGITQATQMVLQKRRNIFHNEIKEQVKVELQFPQVTLEVSTSGGDIIIINLFPAIRGTAWPRGAILQHGLPKQRRYAESGQQCLHDISQQIEDGQTLWYIEARPITLQPSLQTKARFRGGLRRILGGVDRLWRICLTPALKLIHENAAVSAYSESEIRVSDIRNVMMAIAHEHCWDSLTPALLDTLLLWTVKRSLADKRGTGSFFFEVASLLRRTLLQGSCPDFLMPNVNAAEHLNEGLPQREEATEIAAELETIISDIQQTPSELLRYVGYYRSGNDAKSARKSALSRKTKWTHSWHSSHTTIYSVESKTK